MFRVRSGVANAFPGHSRTLRHLPGRDHCFANAFRGHPQGVRTFTRGRSGLCARARPGHPQ
eukprot:3006580-Lingulodinium_polyedra.AAC.1